MVVIVKDVMMNIKDAVQKEYVIIIVINVVVVGIQKNIKYIHKVIVVVFQH